MDGSVLIGTVAAFDAERGWGEIVGRDGGSYGFHCASIADGSRTVAVGAAVRFRRRARLGAVEAVDVDTAAGTAMADTAAV